MYIVINYTKRTTTHHQGNFPDVDAELNNGDDIIIISLYSNTIKKPYCIEDRGIKEWEWEEKPLKQI